MFGLNASGEFLLVHTVITSRPFLYNESGYKEILSAIINTVGFPQFAGSNPKSPAPLVTTSLI